MLCTFMPCSIKINNTNKTSYDYSENSNLDMFQACSLPELYKDPMTDGLNNSEEDFCVKGSIYPRYLRRSDRGWLHSLESDPCSVVHSAACSNHR